MIPLLFIIAYKLNEDLQYQWVTVASGREPSPSSSAVESQSVETATMIHQDVGYGAGKKIHGRKRHLTVDMLYHFFKSMLQSPESLRIVR